MREDASVQSTSSCWTVKTYAVYSSEAWIAVYSRQSLWSDSRPSSAILFDRRHCWTIAEVVKVYLTSSRSAILRGLDRKSPPTRYTVWFCCRKILLTTLLTVVVCWLHSRPGKQVRSLSTSGFAFSWPFIGFLPFLVYLPNSVVPEVPLDLGLFTFSSPIQFTGPRSRTG